MEKEQIKALVREKLASKRIILFGAGIIAKQFYEEFKDKLNISHCVSNIEKEWGEKMFLDELDVVKYRKEDIGEHDYIVVCGPVAFRTIELQLNADGFRMYEGFVESKIATAIASGKKIAVFYGQCILRDIHKFICEVPCFKDKYTTIFTQTAKDQAVVLNRLLYHIKDICDVYVYTPKILDRDSAYSLSREDLPDDCQMISISNLSAPLYWPQIEMDVTIYNEWYVHSYASIRNLNFYHTLYRKEDLNINRLVMEGLSTRKIVEQLSSPDYYSEKEVRRNVRIALKTIDIAERGVDITVGDFIREQYQQRMLYENFLHPTKVLLWEYVRRVLKVLHLPLNEIERLEADDRIWGHDSGEVPIYPSVAQHLQLEFVNADTRYRVMMGSGIVYMTFAEYTEHFVEYTRKAIEIKKMW